MFLIEKYNFVVFNLYIMSEKKKPTVFQIENMMPASLVWTKLFHVILFYKGLFDSKDLHKNFGGVKSLEILLTVVVCIVGLRPTRIFPRGILCTIFHRSYNIHSNVFSHIIFLFFLPWNQTNFGIYEIM
jgi:hypothetical protein